MTCRSRYIILLCREVLASNVTAAIQLLMGVANSGIRIFQSSGWGEDTRCSDNRGSTVALSSLAFLSSICLRGVGFHSCLFTLDFGSDHICRIIAIVSQVEYCSVLLSLGIEIPRPPRRAGPVVLSFFVIGRILASEIWPSYCFFQRFN